MHIKILFSCEKNEFEQIFALLSKMILINLPDSYDSKFKKSIDPVYKNIPNIKKKQTFNQTASNTHNIFIAFS